jgi:hypothetical protein
MPRSRKINREKVLASLDKTCPKLPELIERTPEFGAVLVGIKIFQTSGENIPAEKPAITGPSPGFSVSPGSPNRGGLGSGE